LQSKILLPHLKASSIIRIIELGVKLFVRGVIILIMPKPEPVELVTSDNLILNGLWFSFSEGINRALIFVHGLTGTTFSGLKLAAPLASDKLGVLLFGNRGQQKIAKFRKTDRRRRKGYSSLFIGEAYEKFTDCVYDIQAAVDFARKRGAKEIFLMGNSTGCQKIAYYLSRRKKQDNIAGSILSCPLSDYAFIRKTLSQDKLRRLQELARKMVEDGRGNELLPTKDWSWLHSAQRFLSLYTPDSQEEIFSYCQPNKTPKIFQKIKLPLLVLLAEKDEFRDRSINKIADWFKESSVSRDLEILIIPRALHGFKGQEGEIRKIVKKWLLCH